MAKRVMIKIGDVFSVRIDDTTCKYFQLIAFDPLQLNSEVIRAFKTVYGVEKKLNIDEIVNDEVEFYAHCILKLGIKMGLWEKIGNSPDKGSFERILFRRTNDYGTKAGETPVQISSNWSVWRLGDSDFTRVGKLIGEYREAEIGIIMDPISIVEKVKTGEFGGFYPSFE